MADVDTGIAPTADRINELYWDSDQTVDEIVDELGIGRNTLYSAVRPQPAGASCPDCGGPVAYANRSNRSAETATCVDCGAEVDLAAMPEETEIEAFAREGEGGPHVPERDGGWARWREELAAVAPERAAMIGGAAALGVVFGAVAARAAREMR